MKNNTDIKIIPQKPKVIVTRKLPDDIETRMRELFETTLNETDEPFSKEQLIDAAQKADVLVPTLTDKIDEDFWVLSTAHYDRYLATPDLFEEAHR